MSRSTTPAKRSSNLVHTAMCDRCGSLRDYNGNRMSPSLLCKTCELRTWHGIIGCDQHRQDALDRQRQASATLLARYARLREIFESLGVTFREKPHPRYAYELLTREGQSVICLHPRLRLDAKVEGLELILEKFLDPSRPPGWSWPKMRDGEDAERYLIPEESFQLIPG